NLLLMILGLTGGIIIGSLPGLTATMGVALMVPVTFAMDATSGLIMLGAIYAGAIYGGANSAILICTPGTPSSVATTFDGWPMCQQGQADRGLYSSLISSSFGGMVGTLLLLLLAAPLARFSLKFGGPENFWLCIFGLSTIAVMSSGNMTKGLMSGAIGLLVSTIGLDPHEGVTRFTFGYYPLVQGVAIIPCMIGLFSFSQVLYLIGSYKPFIAEYNPTPGVFRQTFRTLFTKCKVILLRSSIIGGFVGMLPGAGGEIASIIAYNESKRWDKNPDKYGKGAIEGVAASESANNAVIGGALIPMLTLGIPGSAVAAVMLGALLAKGIQPGFKVFTASGDLAYTFIMSQFAVNLLMLPVGFFLAKLMTKLLKVRLTVVAIAIVVLSIIGSYAISNSMLDIWAVLVFGFFGYFCGRVGFDTGAMALGVILGEMIEENLGKTEQLSHSLDGSIITVFLNSPVTIVLMLLTGLSLLTPLFLNMKRGRIDRAEALPSAKHSARSDILSALALFAIVIAFYTQTFDLSGLGLLFPKMLLIFMTGGGVCLLGKGIFKLVKAYPAEAPESASMKRIAMISAGSVLYTLAMPYLGFYPMSVIFMFGMTVILRDSGVTMRRTMLNALLVTAIIMVAVYVTFTWLLNVPTPESSLLSF
ncbi:MAG: tripartite tricarboxylate transporter permease, partial [Desulfovibrio sp.]|nr:tripartite tricarboxylate transporter permease [Desulfovibrio sp.]